MKNRGLLTLWSVYDWVVKDVNTVWVDQWGICLYSVIGEMFENKSLDLILTGWCGFGFVW